MPYSAKQVSELQAERTNDPHTRSYSAMTDVQFLASVILADIASLADVTSVQILNAFEGVDLPAVGSVKRANLELMMSSISGESTKIDGNVLLVLQSIFGAGTTTRSNLVTLANVNLSPIDIAGLPVPNLGDVQRTS